MLFFSITLITLSAGLTFISVFFYICLIAIKTSCNKTDTQQIVILGKKLINNQPDEEYLSRLNRVLTLDKLNLETQLQIYILGGLTGNASISESLSGKHYLLNNNIKTEHIYIEETSRDTLDNMKQFKGSGQIKNTHIVLITNRYHLARASLMAQGFGFTVEKCAAEDSYTPGIFATLTLLSEAFFLHWYLSGRLFAKLTHNRRMLARIE